MALMGEGMTPAAIRASARQGRTPLGMAVERLLQHYLTTVASKAASGYSTGGATLAERRAACARWILLGDEADGDGDPPRRMRELLLRHWLEENGGRGRAKKPTCVAPHEQIIQAAAKKRVSTGAEGDVTRSTRPPAPALPRLGDPLDWISQGPSWYPVAERIRLREVYGAAAKGSSDRDPVSRSGRDEGGPETPSTTGAAEPAEHQGECASDGRPFAGMQQAEPGPTSSGAHAREAGARVGLQIVGTVLGLALSLTGLWLQFGGIWHAFKGHGATAGVLSIATPPLAWFFAVEFFFHDDQKTAGPSR